jgi:hypothetical protein
MKEQPIVHDVESVTAIRGVALGPPDEKRCTAIVESTGEQCRGWKAWRKGLDVCSGHAHLNVAKATAARIEQAGFNRDREEAARLARLEALAQRAEQDVEEADPFDPEEVTAAIERRNRRQADYLHQKRKVDAHQALIYDSPEITPTMIAAGLVWNMREIDPEKGRPPGWVRLPDGRLIVWVKVPAREANYQAPANLIPEDPDVARLRAERMAARDVAAGNDERNVERRKKEIANRIDEVTANGYALAYRAHEAGMGVEEYMESLYRQQDDVYGHAVDLDDPDMREYRDVIAPTLEAQARRKAWASVSALR